MSTWCNEAIPWTEDFNSTRRGEVHRERRKRRQKQRQIDNRMLQLLLLLLLLLTQLISHQGSQSQASNVSSDRLVTTVVLSLFTSHMHSPHRSLARERKHQVVEKYEKPLVTRTHESRTITRRTRSIFHFAVSLLSSIHSPVSQSNVRQIDDEDKVKSHRSRQHAARRKMISRTKQFQSLCSSSRWTSQVALSRNLKHSRVWERVNLLHNTLLLKWNWKMILGNKTTFSPSDWKVLAQCVCTSHLVIVAR